MSAIRVPRTRRKNTVQQRDCHAPGQRPGSRLGPYLDQNVLGQLRRGNPDLNLVLSGGLFSAAVRPGQRLAPPFGANVALENRD